MEESVTPKHTPGPWRVKGDAVVDADNQRIRINGVAMPCGYTPESDESHGNTRLIAAAPELLHLLRQILDSLPSRRDWLDPVIERMARYVVAKAEGRA